MPVFRVLLAVAMSVAAILATPALHARASAGTGNSVLFGTFVPATSSVNHAETYAAFEGTLGRAVSIDRVYSNWDDTQPVTALTDDQAHGRLPLLSIRPQLRSGAKLSWAAVAAGSYDAAIAQQAKALRDFGSPVLLAFHHEADIVTGFGAAADFVAAYRHYVAVFRAAAASNVKFVAIFVPATFASPVIESWYPGDTFVDWIGTDAYNWNNCSNGMGW